MTNHPPSRIYPFIPHPSSIYLSIHAFIQSSITVYDYLMHPTCLKWTNPKGRFIFYFQMKTLILRKHFPPAYFNVMPFTTGTVMHTIRVPLNWIQPIITTSTYMLTDSSILECKSHSSQAKRLHMCMGLCIVFPCVCSRLCLQHMDEIAESAVKKQQKDD